MLKPNLIVYGLEEILNLMSGLSFYFIKSDNDLNDRNYLDFAFTPMRIYIKRPFYRAET